MSDQALGPLANSGRLFVIPKYRLMYVSLAKNACTALKWMMATLGGEDTSRFTLGLRPYTNDMDVIHDRRQWRKVLRVSEVDPKIRAEMAPENGWLIFSVVRDPLPRTFSGWQNKLLLNSPTHARWSAERWYPRFPQDQETIVADFAAFVDMLANNPKHPLHEDTHFRSQVRLLRGDKIKYTRLYDISEMAQLRADVSAHLAGFGWSGELYLPRSNESPLRPIAAVFPDKVRAQLEQIYARDFKRFGQHWDSDKIPDIPWSKDAIAEAQRMTAAGRRMTEMRRIGLEQQREIARLERQIRTMERGWAGVALRVARHGRRLRRRLIAVLTRVAPGLAERLRESLHR